MSLLNPLLDPIRRGMAVKAVMNKRNFELSIPLTVNVCLINIIREAAGTIGSFITLTSSYLQFERQVHVHSMRSRVQEDWRPLRQNKLRDAG